MNRAQAIMFGLGVVALAGGGVVLGRSFARPAATAYGTRIGGMMGLALGLILMIFAIGLSHA